MMRERVFSGRQVPRWLAAGLAIVVAWTCASCSRKGGTVPVDFFPPGIDAADNLLTAEVVIDTAAGTTSVHVTVFDRTKADGYRVYRRVESQGFEPAVDYPAKFAGTFNQGYESYAAVDRDWQDDQIFQYVGRATLQGQESLASPLTNTAVVATTPLEAPDTITMVCPIRRLDSEGNLVPTRTDSLPLFKWNAVPGAVRYEIRAERSDRHLFLLAWTPPTGPTSYAFQSGGGILLHRTTLTHGTYFWSMAAINAQGRVIARTYGPEQFEVNPPEPDPPCTP